MSKKPTNEPPSQSKQKYSQEHLEDLSAFEQEELQWTQHPQLAKYYNQPTVGLHDEIIKQSKSVKQARSRAPESQSISSSSFGQQVQYQQQYSQQPPQPQTLDSYPEPTSAPAMAPPIQYPTAPAPLPSVAPSRNPFSQVPQMQQVPFPSQAFQYPSQSAQVPSQVPSSFSFTSSVVEEPEKDEVHSSEDVLHVDSHGNPVGAEFDLGQEGAFSGFKIIIGNFIPATFDKPIEALKKKGFTVLEFKSELDFCYELPTADVAWIVSGTDPIRPSVVVPPSSGEYYPAWTSVKKADFVEKVLKYHSEGGGLYIWGDNDPLYEHANAILPRIFKDPNVVLIGNTPGQKTLTPGKPNQTGKFGRHVITSGIVSLYEGTTICYPKSVGPMKVLATSSNEHPVVLFADNEVLADNFGRVVVDCGYTKNYISWDSAGSARYIVNACVWLLALEHKVKIGASIEPRCKTNKS